MIFRGNLRIKRADNSKSAYFLAQKAQKILKNDELLWKNCQFSWLWRKSSTNLLIRFNKKKSRGSWKMIKHSKSFPDSDKQISFNRYEYIRTPSIQIMCDRHKVCRKITLYSWNWLYPQKWQHSINADRNDIANHK